MDSTERAIVIHCKGSTAVCILFPPTCFSTYRLILDKLIYTLIFMLPIIVTHTIRSSSNQEFVRRPCVWLIKSEFSVAPSLPH